MSAHKFPKSSAVIESNIPVPKKNNSGMKKSKGCAQLPELQKYIETIIKASNEYDSEDTSISDRDKFPKDRKFGKYSYKGLDGKAKQEKDKNQLNMSGSKNSIKAKTQISEAVSRGVKVYNTFAPEFEDPRNWKLGKPQNLGPKVEIEQFLKKFFPNPYQLESVNEFKPSNNDKDELRDGTLPDVVISKANIHTEVDIEKRDTDLQTADNKPCKRENKDLNLASDTSLAIQSPRRSENKDSEVRIYSLSVPVLTKKASTAESIQSMSNTSTRASSPDSMTETLSKNSQMSIRKRKSTKPKKRSKPIKIDDYDIGKLKLLNISDSEATSKPRPENSKTESKDSNSKENDSELSEDIYNKDFKELEEIYDIMHKATESFISMTSKNESTEVSKSVVETTQSVPNKATKPELDTSESNNPATSKLELSNSDKAESEIHKTKEDQIDNSSSTVTEKEERENEKGLLNVLLRQDNFEYGRNTEESNPETVHEIASNCETISLEGISADISEEEKDFKDTSHKIDEVLDFMYDCLKKFNKEIPPPEEKQKSAPEDSEPLEKSISCNTLRKESVMDINYEKPTTSANSTDSFCTVTTENLLAKTFPDIKDIQSKYSAALGEINRKSSRIRCRKRPSLVANESSSLHQIPVNAVPTPGNTSPQIPSFQQSVDEINENQLTLQTAESQNELGSFTEECQVVTEESRTPKPICPLSVKQKKSKTNSGKTLKDVLEAEEKLMSSEESKTEVEEKSKDAIISSTENQNRAGSDTTKVYSYFTDFKRPSANFVVCVNSPRNLRNITSMRPNLPIFISPSSTGLGKDWSKQFISPPKLHKKLCVIINTECCVLQHSYNIKQEILLTLNKTFVVYTAQPVCLKIIISFSKSVEELLLKKSECSVTITTIAVQLDEMESTSSVKTTPQVDIEDDKPVKDLIEAIEETEEKLFLLEQNSAENLYSRNSEMCSLSASETLKNDIFLEYEGEKISNRKKVHDLLLRTYNLQQKLQCYLQKLSCSQPTSLSCPVVQQEAVSDFIPRNKIKSEFDVKPENSLPVVHWHLKPPENDVIVRADESITVNVSMIDHSTSYEPPVEEKCEKKEEAKLEKSGKENEERVSQDEGNDEDDRSSNYSFKSSNDYSESSEAKAKKESKHFDYMENKKFFKKIFDQIESFRQSFEAEKLEKQQQQIESIPKEPEEPVDKRLGRYDPKTPAKVLRTVFTGKKSSTELTIGLKDVPMTKVGNISVEKTKFSPNHTKISVAFTKECPEENNKLSPYYFENMRPSLSTCETEYSQLKDDESKTSQSLNPESDEDEEDYKSVGSTMGNSDRDVDEETKSEPKEQKPVEESSSKNFTKHRFDFYRKMNTDLDISLTKPKSASNSVCGYKELEPLKQALTDMQIRMRDIKRDAALNGNDYYERALKLAKMSAGFCQSCGNRAVIPNDTFGYYRTLLPRRSTHNRRTRHFRPSLSSNPSFYSLRSSNVEVCDQFCELGIKHSSYVLNPRLHSNRTVLRSSLHDMPILFERM